MGNKAERLSLIRHIIEEDLIGSQEELIKRLAEHGVHATQSTLSRDFKEINISKMPHHSKGYIYVLSDVLGNDAIANTSNIGEAVLDIKFSHNIAVIFTKSGYASAISTIIDSHKSKEILGTVAGDNNIIIILSENTTHEDILAQMQQLFPTLAHL